MVDEAGAPDWPHWSDDDAATASARRGASIGTYVALTLTIAVTAIVYWNLVAVLVPDADTSSNWWFVGEVVFQLTVILCGWKLVTVLRSRS